MEKGEFSKLLINWYNHNKRPLPWRETHEPYRIWISEIILQQTRVDQGLPYYLRFLTSFPDIKALANASEKDVLRLWQGLGYYSRARNLHFTAKTVILDHKGQMPDTYSGLLKLKGIGPYTAAAIASFAYQEKVAVVDGNVYRVLSRIFGITDDISSLVGQKKIQQLADELLPDENSDSHNQAIMEFGALQCTPQNPRCDQCPMAFACYAFVKNAQNELPVKLKKTKKTNRFFHYLAFKNKDGYLLKERKNNDIWKGLYEFPLIEEKELLEIGELLENHFGKDAKSVFVKLESPEYKHILSHQNIKAKFWVIESTEIAEKLIKMGRLRFYNAQEVQDLPKHVLINKFLEEFIF